MVGVLLFGWAAFIVWLADKRQSELMAFSAISGAFYASFIPLIHGSGGAILMLVSNAVLSAAAVWFLIRNRWAKLTAGAVVATYVGFAIWRFVIERPQLAEPGMFWISLAFLVCYWSIFSAAAIYSRSPQLSGWPRALLLGSNSIHLRGYSAGFVAVSRGLGQHLLVAAGRTWCGASEHSCTGPCDASKGNCLGRYVAGQGAHSRDFGSCHF